VSLHLRSESFDPYTFPLEPWWFMRPESIHGLAHTRRVLIHAVPIAEAAGLEAIEFEALVHAVAWHDIGRTHDGWDRDHGRKSVARVKELDLAHDLAPEMLEPLFFAIEWHSTDDDLAVEAVAPQAVEAAEIAEAAPHADPQAAVKEAGPDPAPDPTRDSRLRVLWVLKDADGLDRVRIHDLDVARLRSAAARVREAEAWRLLAELP
jgi:hypothetical protein